MNIPLNIDWQQIFLHLLNFAILAAGLYFLLYKPVKDFMDKRQEHYRLLELNAKEKLSEADKRKADYDELLQNADTEMKNKMSEAMRSAEEFRLAEEQQAKQKAEKIIQEARKEAERERYKIVDGAKKEVAEMVTMAAEKLLINSTVSDNYEQFLEEAERSVRSESSK